MMTKELGGRKVFARFLAAMVMVALYAFNTVVLTGFALTASTTDAKAHNGGRSGGRGRGRGWGGGRGRGRGRGRGAWWAGSCHVPGTSLWFGECW
jgi:hypothetical protein